MQMDVEIGGGAKALDEGDGTGIGFAAFEPSCLIRKRVMMRWITCNTGVSSCG